MSSPIDGGPAFPLGDFEWNEKMKHNNGMSLRDWIAGQAFASAISSANGLGDISKEKRYKLLLVAATICYEGADAMLEAKAREAKP